MSNPGWREARDPATKRLLFRYDPDRDLIESVCSYWDKTIRKRVYYKIVTDLAMVRDLVAPLRVSSQPVHPVEAVEAVEPVSVKD